MSDQENQAAQAEERDDDGCKGEYHAVSPKSDLTSTMASFIDTIKLTTTHTTLTAPKFRFYRHAKKFHDLQLSLMVDWVVLRLQCRNLRLRLPLHLQPLRLDERQRLLLDPLCQQFVLDPFCEQYVQLRLRQSILYDLLVKIHDAL